MHFFPLSTTLPHFLLKILHPDTLPSSSKDFRIFNIRLERLNFKSVKKKRIEKQRKENEPMADKHDGQTHKTIKMQV